MRHILAAALLSTCASMAIADPTPKEQLLVPPKDAVHYVIVSTAGKHGDAYMWTLPDGRMAFRDSILLRGLTFETDETMRLGADGMPSEVVIRGVTPRMTTSDGIPSAPRRIVSSVSKVRPRSRIESRKAMRPSGRVHI